MHALVFYIMESTFKYSKDKILTEFSSDLFMNYLTLLLCWNM